MTVAPDIGVLRIGVEAVATDMSEAVASLSRKSRAYSEFLGGLDLGLDDIQTTSFAVRENRVYLDGEHVDSGYVASQQVTVEFAYSPRRLASMLSSIGEAPGDADLSFGFELSEARKDSVQAAILVQAYQSAQSRAESLAAAAGVRLAGLLAIDYEGSHNYYGMQELDPVYAYAAAAAATESDGFGFRPADLIFYDSVDLEYATE